MSNLERSLETWQKEMTTGADELQQYRVPRESTLERSSKGEHKIAEADCKTEVSEKPSSGLPQPSTLTLP